MAIGKRTEKAIKAWLKLPKEDRSIGSIYVRGTIVLYDETNDEGSLEVGRFTLKSIVAKRYPRRKKK